MLPPVPAPVEEPLAAPGPVSESGWKHAFAAVASTAIMAATAMVDFTVRILVLPSAG
jgi:hypothetical protein